MSQSFPEMFARSARRKDPDRQPEQSMRRTRHQTADMLGRIPIFADLSRRHLNRLAADTDELEFAPGQIIVRQADPGEALFVVLSGEAKVMRGGRKVGEVVPGDFFGELSAIDGGPRTASIVAVTPVRLLRLFRRTLTSLIKEDPAVTVKLIDGMTRRFRQVERQQKMTD
jgi:CRP/FNR family transcriptional regulator, cyclic AMP receptor protein